MERQWWHNKVAYQIPQPHRFAEKSGVRGQPDLRQVYSLSAGAEKSYGIFSPGENKALLVMGNFQEMPQKVKLPGVCEKVLINNMDQIDDGRGDGS